MTKLKALFCALVLIPIVACAGPFDTCVKPELGKITWSGTAKELGEVVGAFLACDPILASGDAPSCALSDLEALALTLGPDGRTIVNCLIAYYEGNGTPVQKKAARAVAVKRGIHAETLRCPAPRLPMVEHFRPLEHRDAPNDWRSGEVMCVRNNHAGLCSWS